MLNGHSLSTEKTEKQPQFQSKYVVFDNKPSIGYAFTRKAHFWTSDFWPYMVSS